MTELHSDSIPARRVESTSATDDAEGRAACEAREYERAVTIILKRHGAEVFGFLLGRLRNHADASEVFSMFSEDLWRGLPLFEWRCGLRGYCYALARNAANRFSVAPDNRAGRRAELAQTAFFAEIAANTRTLTAAHLRTEAKDRLRQLRERLSEADQTLLILRIDRGLSFRELACVMHDDGVALTEPELSACSARLRKRFQLVKEKLRALARDDGLLDG